MAYNFEILCVDSNGSGFIENDNHLTHSLLANGKLWKNPKQKGDNIISDNELKLTITIGELDNENYLGDVDYAFLIKCVGAFEGLESFRLPLIKYLKSQNFEHIYVLNDEISTEIATKLYPRINKIENQLRGYLIKFFVTKLGPNWWNLTADNEMQNKARKRKFNEKDFSDFIENKSYLIDFGELGKVVHSQSSGFLSKEDIIARITQIDETDSETISKLKSELSSNYIKFFKESFKDKGFQEKWQELEKIRHKVAHNNLFVLNDLNRGNEITNELESIIADAVENIDKIVFSIKQKQDFIASLPEVGGYRHITENELYQKLISSTKWVENNDGAFIGLTSFIKNYLGSIGFHYNTSIEVLQNLKNKGVVEFYEQNDENFENPVTAIRLIGKLD